MDKNKVIFLDCDGVLNRILDGDNRYFHPECFRAFQHIVRETRAKIVLSTSWREFADWEHMLRDWFGAIGIKVIGKTPIRKDGVREEEISDYLNAHRYEIENFLVLDDIDMRASFPNNCICTCEPGRIGLDWDWAEDAISILNKNEIKRKAEECGGEYILKISRRNDGKLYYYRHDGCLTARRISSWRLDKPTAQQLAAAIRKNNNDFTARAVPYVRKKKANAPRILRDGSFEQDKSAIRT